MQVPRPLFIVCADNESPTRPDRAGAPANQVNPARKFKPISSNADF